MNDFEYCGGQASLIVDILLEPVARNTAPDIALAALHARKDGQDPLLLKTAAEPKWGLGNNL